MALVPINLGVPTGTVMWYAGQEVPYGWLVCDGGEALTAEFPVLASYLGTTFGPGTPATFTLPDLVGKFIRGAGAETGRPFGSTQNDLFGTHSHAMPQTKHTHVVTDPGHFHDVNDPGHAHSITDPGHEHSVFPAEHNHNVLRQTAGYLFILLTTESEALYAGQSSCKNSGASGCPTDQNYITFGWDVAVTGISVNIRQTNIRGPYLARARVSWRRNRIGINALGFSQTGITVNDNDTVDTHPINISLLPIIRT